ncbi:MAG: DUF2480 family protein [Bacteroidia bacterium]|jgi:hypothetical protein|nr:DUF2480 family protein [Bacteroidia bacterium]
MSEIINKVAGSGIVSINLEEYFTEGERVEFDIKPFLFQKLILKEKEFREALKTHSWERYRGKLVNVVCSADAIVPTWAFMLVVIALEPFAKRIFCSEKSEMELLLFKEKLATLRPEEYKGARVVIKGCADKPVPLNAFAELTALLKPHVKSIMYGEPCSTVPLYKAKP